MTAVLGVDLGEAEDLRVGQRTTVLFLQSMEVFNLFRTEGQTLLFVVFLEVIYILDRLGLDVNCKDILIKTIVHTLQHLVVFSIF